MPPRKKKAVAAKLRSWRVSIIRKRGEYLGTVEGRGGTLTGLAAIAWALPASAQDSQAQSKPPAKSVPAKPTFEFRSHRIGQVLDTRYPDWRQGKKHLFRPGCEVDRDEVGVISCEDAESFEYEGSGFMATSRRVVDGVPIMLLSYKFFDGKLYSLDMGFAVNEYGQIREMLVGKYGKPTREKASTIQNRAGASFDNIATEWDFREGTLRLNMRYGRIDTSWVKFENPIVEKQIKARRGAIGQQKGKSAF
jgi:hypothetical protein